MYRVISATALLMSAVAMCACGRIGDDTTGDGSDDGSLSDATTGPWDCGDTGLGGLAPLCDSDAACQQLVDPLIHDGVAHTICVSLNGNPSDARCHQADHSFLAGSLVKTACGNEADCTGFSQLCVTTATNPNPHCATPCSQ